MFDINDKKDTIENMYGSARVFAIFLVNMAYNLDQDNVKNAILDKRVQNAILLGIASNIFLSTKESLVTNEGNLVYSSTILDDELSKMLTSLFTLENGNYYYGKHLMGDGATTINKLRNKLAHGLYILDMDKSTVTISDDNDMLEFDIRTLVNFVYQALYNSIYKKKDNYYDNKIIFTLNGKPNRQKPFKDIKELEKYINTHKTLKASIEGINGYKITEEDKSKLDKITNNYINQENFKEFKKFEKENLNKIKVTYEVEELKNIDTNELATSLFTMTKKGSTYGDVQLYIGETLRKINMQDLEKIGTVSLSNIALIDGISRCNTIDYQILNKTTNQLYGNMSFSTDSLAYTLVSMFNTLFSYGRDKLLNNNETNIFTDNDKFDYSQLDLSKFNVTNYTFDTGYLKAKLERKTAVEKMITKLNKSIKTTQVQINNLTGVTGKESVINNLKTKIQNDQKEIQNLTKEKNEIEVLNNYFNSHQDYFIKKAIINGIRNSIAHGHYKIDYTKDYENASIEFNDIYKGKTTFQASIKIIDFFYFFIDNEKSVLNYLGNMKGKSLWKTYTL